MCIFGKDSKLIYNNRHLSHINPDTKNKLQKIDKVLQANPKDYVYEQVLFCDEYWLEILEEALIRQAKPTHNILLKGNVELKDIMLALNKLQRDYNIDNADINKVKELIKQM